MSEVYLPRTDIMVSDNADTLIDIKNEILDLLTRKIKDLKSIQSTEDLDTMKSDLVECYAMIRDIDRILSRMEFLLAESPATLEATQVILDVKKTYRGSLGLMYSKAINSEFWDKIQIEFVRKY